MSFVDLCKDRTRQSKVRSRKDEKNYYLLIQEAAHLAAAAGVLQLAQGLGLDLADTFAPVFGG